MKKPKVVILTVSVLSLFAGTLLFGLIIAPCFKQDSTQHVHREE